MGRSKDQFRRDRFRYWRRYYPDYAGLRAALTNAVLWRQLTGDAGFELATQELAMTRKPSSIVAIILVMLATLGSIALAAQNRYALKLGDLALSDFKGYEN